MKPILVCISSAAGSEHDIDAVKEATQAVVTALQERSVNVTAVLRGKTKFQPSSIMNADVESMVKDLEYSYAKIPNVTYPTNKLSDNGKDEEYYLNAIFEEDKITVVINITAGLINIFKD